MLDGGGAAGGTSETLPGAGNAGGGNAADPKERDAEETAHGQTVAVYCCWHRLNRRRYVWTDGVPRFLRNEPYSGPAPLVPITLTHTPKRPFPVSMGLAGWKLQKEINQTLTEAKGARRARYPRYLLKRGAMDPEDFQAVQGCSPHAIVEVDEPEEVKKAFEVINGVEYDPRLYDVSPLFRLMEIELGVTMQQIGLSTGGSTATEIERAQQGAQTTAAMHASQLNKSLRRLYRMLLSYIAEYVTPEQVAFILGPEDAQGWAMFPKDREQIAAGLQVDVLAAPNGPQAQMALAEAWMKTADAFARVGQTKVLLGNAGEALNTTEIYQAIATAMNLGLNGDELVRQMRPGELPPMMTPGEAEGLSGQPG
jgi:hypothetical protein